MYDPHSRESRGFGFVTMESGEEADAAITALNGTDFQGRTLSIEKVRSSLSTATLHTYSRVYRPAAVVLAHRLRDGITVLPSVAEVVKVRSFSNGSLSHLLTIPSRIL